MSLELLISALVLYKRFERVRWHRRTSRANRDFSQEQIVYLNIRFYMLDNLRLVGSWLRGNRVSSWIIFAGMLLGNWARLGLTDGYLPLRYFNTNPILWWLVWGRGRRAVGWDFSSTQGLPSHRRAHDFSPRKQWKRGDFWESRCICRFYICTNSRDCVAIWK